VSENIKSHWVCLAKSIFRFFSRLLKPMSGLSKRQSIITGLFCNGGVWDGCADNVQLIERARDEGILKFVNAKGCFEWWVAGGGVANGEMGLEG
jgi:hypothetical protein